MIESEKHFMNYRGAREYIETIQEKFGSDYSLRDVKELARRAGHPERAVKVIHIAGTNGKGSVGTYIGNILAASGYRVGRYASPAVYGYREQFTLLQRADSHSEVLEITSVLQVSEREVAETVTYLKAMCEEIVQEGFGQPTSFELETVMAFLLFKKWKVDIAIVECGLGGRLDATNIIPEPVLCVFTAISRDHMKLLGNTVQEIAREKYGIIQEGTEVVSGYQPECEAVLREVCNEKKAELTFMDGEKLQKKSLSEEEAVFWYRDTLYQIKQGGSFQPENAALSLEAVWRLKEKGFCKITGESIQEGLLESHWGGRFEVLSRSPFLLVDGAHNEDAAKRLRESLELYFPKEKFSFIIGMFRDKEYEKVLSILLPLAEKVYAVTTSGKRGLSGSILCECAAGKGILQENIFDCGGIENALLQALKENRGGKTIVCGSLSILREVRIFCMENFQKSGGDYDRDSRGMEENSENRK